MLVIININKNSEAKNVGKKRGSPGINHIWVQTSLSDSVILGNVRLNFSSLSIFTGKMEVRNS